MIDYSEAMTRFEFMRDDEFPVGSTKIMRVLEISARTFYKYAYRYLDSAKAKKDGRWYIDEHELGEFLRKVYAMPGYENYWLGTPKDGKIMMPQVKRKIIKLGSGCAAVIINKDLLKLAGLKIGDTVRVTQAYVDTVPTIVISKLGYNEFGQIRHSGDSEEVLYGKEPKKAQGGAEVVDDDYDYDVVDDNDTNL